MTFENKYTSKPLFPYALGYCYVFPKGLENKFKVGKGNLIIEENYIIFIKEGTPDEIKDRFIKEYAEYHSKKEAEHKAGIYNDL